ncbi:MAG TPA: polysaccharide deacetylase family protein [Jiangellaceae bacterium]|nr:polysaccharide deacetylase family protein [Jiangellaceae bacterium]
MRSALKRTLAVAAGRRLGPGATLLTYHRVGGGSSDELDLSASMFAAQVEALTDADVVSLDTAADRLAVDDDRSGVVLTFDDGYGDVYDNAWPLLRRHELPFTMYLASRYMGATMQWPGATAKSPGPALTWHQLREMVDSGLCTLGNHTHSHVRPEHLTTVELDRCSDEVERRLGLRPTHFTYPWGIPVPRMENELRRRFRTASTGELGRNLPGDDPIRLRRVPVRRTDPIEFFRAKLLGELVPERVYARVVGTAKAVGLRA